MSRACRFWTAALALVVSAAPVLAQQPPPPPPSVPATTPAFDPHAIAATVNGQPIYEIAVQRGLRRVPAGRQVEARPEFINFLIDNALIEQYLTQLPVTIDPKDVDAKVQQVRDELKKEGSTFERMLQEFGLTEVELRGQILAQLRWERFVAMQAGEPALRQLFDGNRDMFDGTVVRARHILLTPASKDPQANEAAKMRLAAMKKQIEEQAMQGLAKLPPQTDNLEREKARAKLVDEAFAALAVKESACPSKAQGGDIGFFPRSGGMVEPFAKAAFALKPFQLSEVTTTQFGHHLILVTDRRAGKEVKLEEVKEDVREVLGDRLREALVARLRPAAQLAVNPSLK